MNRAHAATMLLKLGPLQFDEFVTITGWKEDQARSTLKYLHEKGILLTLKWGAYSVIGGEGLAGHRVAGRRSRTGACSPTWRRVFLRLL